MTERVDAVEFIDTTDLTPISQSGDEVRYNCPCCYEKRGKEDTDGKFYFNVVKESGYCFKCHTIFYREGSGKDTARYVEDILDREGENFLRNQSLSEAYENLEYPTEVYFNFPELDMVHLEYLKMRNPYLIPLIDLLGIRAWKGRDSGVVLPFFYRGKICKFQARFIKRQDPKGAKYYTSMGPKPLYSPFHIFNYFKTPGKIDEITISEGVFDAIALACLGFPNPVAVLGDRLSALQAWDLRNLNPAIHKVYVCLDDVERCAALKKVLQFVLPCVESIDIFGEWGGAKDPEELLRYTLPTNVEFRNQCTERVMAWVQAYS